MERTNKQVVIEFFRALGQGEIAALSSLATEDMVITTRGKGKLFGDRDRNDVLELSGVLKRVTQTGIVFEPLHLTAEDDRVAYEAAGHSTLLNGERYDNLYHFLVFLRGGKVCRVFEYLDTKLVEDVLGPFVSADAV